MGADVKPAASTSLVGNVGPVSAVNQGTSSKSGSVKKTPDSKMVASPAAVLELSSEGIHKLDSEKAQALMKQIKEQLPKEDLSAVHSHLRAMKINHLVFD